MSRARNEVVMMLSQEQAKLSIRNAIYSTTRMKIYKKSLKAVSESPPAMRKRSVRDLTTVEQIVFSVDAR